MSIEKIRELAAISFSLLTQDDLLKLIGAEITPDGYPTMLGIAAQDELKKCYGSWGASGLELKRAAKLERCYA